MKPRQKKHQRDTTIETLTVLAGSYLIVVLFLQLIALTYELHFDIFWASAVWIFAIAATVITNWER